MNTNWTPGPWEVGTHRCIRSATGVICGTYSHMGTAEANANEHLIAAAPDLYEALLGILEIVSDSSGVSGFHLNGDVADWDYFDEINTATAALAKARGEA